MGELKFKTVLLAVAVTLVLKCSADEPVFSTIGPRVLGQGHVYKFSASAAALKKTLIVDFKLSGTDDDGDYYEFNIIKQKISNEMRNYVFNTESLKPGKYQLSANAYDPLMKTSYYDVQSLIYVKTRFSTSIQTDKAMYKAGDLINFRIFAFDSETRPFNLNSAVVTIYDSTDTKIKSFANITFNTGIYENLLQLSESPSLGNWRIRVEAGSDVFEKSIEVQDYILPTYSVRVDAPSQVAIADKTFIVKVTAEYTFGQAVAGVAVVKFSRMNYYWGWWRGGGGSQTELLYQRSVIIDSEAETFEVDIAEDLKILYVDGSNIVIDVEFTEELTRKTVEASTSLNIVQYAYTAIFTGEQTYAPNTSYSFKLSLRKFDGTSAPAGTSVTVYLNFYSYCNFWPCNNNYKNVQQNYLLDSTGSAVIQVDTENFDYLSVSQSSPISNDGYWYANKQQNTLTNLLDLVVLTAKPKIGSKVSIQVSTSLTTISKCYCQLISKGGFLESQRVTLKSQKGIFSFIPNFAYAPTSEVICYFYNSAGSIASKRVSISFRDDLPNFLELELSAQTVEPGRNLSLKVSSALKSKVALLAIDQSVLLLRTGNDLSKGDVISSLDKYNYIDNNWWWNNPSDQQEFFMINFFVLKRLIDYPKPKTTTTTTKKMKTTTSTQTFGSTTEEPIFWEMEAPVMVQERPVQVEMDMAIEAPMASQSAPGVSVSKAEVAIAPPRVRKNFFETLLWETVDIRKNKKCGRSFDKFRGEEIVKFTAPDSITSYVFSGVSMNDEYGMGLPDTKPSLKVFLSFFIQANLPNHMKRGEVLMQDIVIFNYLSNTQNVIVSVKRNDNKFGVLNPEFDGWQVASDKYWQNITSVANKPKGLRIVIRPKVLGFIDIAIEAVGPLAGDSVLKPLKVIPEGISKSITQSALISKNVTSSLISASLHCTLPSTAVNDTTSASASIVGDLMGDMIKNLESLIQMSYGCGEQNMLNFVPNIVALIYLEATGQISDALRSKAISFAEDGYQRELTYKRNDGSFSAFGNSDTSGSTWLTAYVIKSFLWARPYIQIDSAVIKNGLAYITSKQNPDGSFREDGRVIHSDMQGGSSKGLAMTAYISIVLSEDIAEFEDFTDARNKALNYISDNLDENDVYALAISSYALYLGNHSDFSWAYEKLLLAKIETPDQIRWEKPSTNTQDQNSWWWNCQPRSNDIEITAYALQLIQNFDIAQGVKIAKYLISQKNAYGGYGSSQDTVVGLTALAGFSIKFHSTAGTLDIHLVPDLGSAFNAQVNAANMLTVQVVNLNPLARELNVTSGVGSVGSAIVSLTCNFYVVDEETSPRFQITQRFVRPCKQFLKSQICLSYIPRDGDIASNMALMKMTLPSGYTYDSDNVTPDFIRRLDKKDGDTTIEAYFDSLTSAQTCFDIPSIQTNIVENLKDATIEIIDYYDTTKKAQILYSTPADLINCVDLPIEEESSTTTYFTDIFIIDPKPMPMPMPIMILE